MSQTVFRAVLIGEDRVLVQRLETQGRTPKGWYIYNRWWRENDEGAYIRQTKHEALKALRDYWDGKRSQVEENLERLKSRVSRIENVLANNADAMEVSL